MSHGQLVVKPAFKPKSFSLYHSSLDVRTMELYTYKSGNSVNHATRYFSNAFLFLSSHSNIQFGILPKFSFHFNPTANVEREHQSIKENRKERSFGMRTVCYSS